MPKGIGYGSRRGGSGTRPGAKGGKVAVPTRGGIAKGGPKKNSGNRPGKGPEAGLREKKR